jgi:hypothetical protein
MEGSRQGQQLQDVATPGLANLAHRPSPEAQIAHWHMWVEGVLLLVWQQ